jgi:hypothetical protein
MQELPAEESLVRKLVTTWHLNVPERRALPGGKARVSIVIAVIQGALESEGWFPAGCRPDDEFNGGLIEVRAGGSCRIYWDAEVSMCRCERVSVDECRSTRDAVAAYVTKSWGGNIDGVPLDWTA